MFYYGPGTLTEVMRSNAYYAYILHACTCFESNQTLKLRYYTVNRVKALLTSPFVNPHPWLSMIVVIIIYREYCSVFHIWMFVTFINRWLWLLKQTTTLTCQKLGKEIDLIPVLFNLFCCCCNFFYLLCCTTLFQTFFILQFVTKWMVNNFLFTVFMRIITFEIIIIY